MMMDVFMKSVVGYKNIIKNQNSQDYADYKIIDNMLVCVVADGHSTDFFKYSNEGARFACKACIDIIEEYSYKMRNEWEQLLVERSIQKLICEKWKGLVEEHYKKNNPIVFRTEYIKYSTTLVAAFITEDFVIFLKLGDGNVVLKRNGEYKKIIKMDNENMVHSLGKYNAHENMKFIINDTGKFDKNSNIILFTDGYENCFRNEEELFDSLEQTIKKYNQSVFSRKMLKYRYESYLKQLSKNKSQDDISIIFVV